MVQTFAVNNDHDIFLGSDGNLSIATGIQGVLQACETATYAQLGEMILATTSGMPNFQTIWVGQPNYPLWNLYLRNTLQAVQGVVSVQNVQITKNNNTLRYTATIETLFGTSQFSGSLTQG